MSRTCEECPGHNLSIHPNLIRGRCPGPLRDARQAMRTERLPGKRTAQVSLPPSELGKTRWVRTSYGYRYRYWLLVLAISYYLLVVIELLVISVSTGILISISISVSISVSVGVSIRWRTSKCARVCEMRLHARARAHARRARADTPCALLSLRARLDSTFAYRCARVHDTRRMVPMCI